jgi:hypothetical protein
MEVLMLDAGNCAPGCDATEGPEQPPLRRQYTLKGVEAEAIDLMRSAAHREGMKINAWVSYRLREAAERTLAKDDSPSSKTIMSASELPGTPGDVDTAWLVARIHDLEREVQEMNKTQRLLMVKLLEHL